MCEEKPVRKDCRDSDCSKSNTYIVPNDRTAKQLQRLEEKRK